MAAGAYEGLPPLFNGGIQVLLFGDGQILALITTILIFAVVVYAESVRVEKDADRVHVHVKDTGVGISDEKQPYVFDPFVKVGERRPDERGGVGLGLAISRDLAEAMDGALTVESEKNKGSVFTVTLLRPSRTAGASGASNS
jgi:signal transduction histidine kinase